MKRILYFTLVGCLAGCASAPQQRPQGYALPPALSEVYRGGELAPLQQTNGPVLGMPDPYDQVSHTCVSTPIWGIDGRYVRTSVRCW